MKIVLFYQSLLSDWNHGNAHFLRGYAAELVLRGHDVEVYEPDDSWCYSNLLLENGAKALNEFSEYYPMLKSIRYAMDKFVPDKVLNDASLVIVHEWNSHKLVKEIGDYRKNNPYFKLLFHDTHHRIITDRENMLCYDLSGYDGVLAYGETLRDMYVKDRLAENAWIWHEAADTRIFYPREIKKKEGDVIWIGNWGDEERSEELLKFLIYPVKELGLKCKIYGVRYPEEALNILEQAGIEYGGWLPNFKVPEEFGKYKLTVHIPRRPYVKLLPGIPTIRPFEALACGIPMISSPWRDMEHLFNPGKDFLFAGTQEEMTRCIEEVLSSDEKREEMKEAGLLTIRSRHSCAHRVDELYDICSRLGLKLN